MMTIDNTGNNTSLLVLNEQSKSFLKETAKWTNFLSIIGFIGIGFLVIVALFFSSFIAAVTSSDFPATTGGGTIFTILYLLIAALYFLPVLYLYKFSSNMKKAIDTEDQETLTNSFENLKSHYKFIGIFAIISIAFYVLILLVGIIAGVSAM